MAVILSGQGVCVWVGGWVGAGGGGGGGGGNMLYARYIELYTMWAYQMINSIFLTKYEILFKARWK